MLKHLFKFLNSIKELLVAIVAYSFGHKHGVEKVEKKIIEANFKERRKRRESDKRIIARWKRIRGDAIPAELSGEAHNDNTRKE